MFGRNSSNFSPYQYKKLLSPFGQTVLDVLIKQARSEQEQSTYKMTSFKEKPQHVLTFQNDTMPPIVNPHTYLPHNSHNEPDEDPFDFQPEILNIPSSCNTIPATGEFLITPRIYHNQDKQGNNNTCREDLIKPAHVKLTSNDDAAFYQNKDKVKEFAKYPIIETNKQDVTWNNMFDSQLFGDVITDFNSDLNNIKVNDKIKEKDNKPNETTSILLNKPKHNKINVLSNERVTLEELTKNMKRKLQTQITNTTTKKIKNNPSTKKPESSFRKQKYTKAVKNWLNDVDPKNPIDEDIIQESDINVNKENEQIKRENKVPINIKLDHDQSKKHNIEVGPKNNAVKKTVQSKLANKDGVMKFKNPKVTATKSNATSEYSSDNNINSDDKDFAIVKPDQSDNKSTFNNGKADHSVIKSDFNNAKNDNSKTDNTDNNTSKKVQQGSQGLPEKKVKPKFIPPIKSQLPVKDIVYKVAQLTENNVFEGDDLFAAEQQNISIVLMFANGFNQLNIQYTEEETRASGLMIKNDNTHYFLRTRDVEQRTLQLYSEKIRKLVTNNMIQCFDAKHVLMHLINKMDLIIPPQEMDSFDLKIAGALLFPDNIPETFTAVQKSLGESASYAVCTECPLQKCGWYLQQFETNVAVAKSMLLQLNMKIVFYDIEMKLVPIVAGMECHGLKVDVNELSRAEQALVRELKVAEDSCKELGGADFSPASLTHTRRVLYDELKLHTHTNVPHTALTHQRSTNEETLRALSFAHELPGRILRYRHVSRARALLTALSQRVQHGDKLAPCWIQIASCTGRMAATNPNLQAIPKTPFIVTGDDGKVESINLRSILVPAPDSSLVSLDFDHVECRLAARLAGDRLLLQALRHQDLFQHLAAHWLNKPASSVSAEERERAKKMVYASMYGAGTRKLMDILNLNYPQTRDLVTTFNHRFPRLKEFCAEVWSRCDGSGGRLYTDSGRNRFIPHAQANTQAVNFIVQGTAADVCKRAMISAVAANTPASLLLQIHDELLWEVPTDQLHKAIAVIRECMEQSGVGERLPVSVSVGPNWGEMTPYIAPTND